MTGRCGNCVFAKDLRDPPNNGQEFQCRRFPPQAVTKVYAMGPTFAFEWPVVFFYDWCGEFEPSGPRGDVTVSPRAS